jgi:hypothetical protein
VHAVIYSVIDPLGHDLASMHVIPHPHPTPSFCYKLCAKCRACNSEALAPRAMQGRSRISSKRLNQ